jgi:signal transduction histidine kinase
VSGEIKITTESTADKIKVSISDNGGGIEPSVLAKIYDPFFTTKEIGKGTGLGLSIAYGIIERHKGVISVNSVVNKGTTFIIELPLMNVR